MRLRVVHETAYRYKTPASRAIEILRLTPRGHDGQYVVNWRIDIDRDCRLDAAIDPFGNASPLPPRARSRRPTPKASSRAR